MKFERSFMWHLRTMPLLVLWSVTMSCVPVMAGSLVVPAWAFDRGNVQIHANPEQYADAGPLVVSGEPRPWGWTVEYDIDVPVAGNYTLQIRYASAEARPVDVFFDNRNIGRCCNGVTFAETSTAKPVVRMWSSSGAAWDGVQNQWGRSIKLAVTKGMHTVKIIRRQPLPHLVALRLDTTTAFPEDWRPPLYTVRNRENIPVAYRETFKPQGGATVEALRLAIEDTARAFGTHYTESTPHLRRLAELEKGLAATAAGTPAWKELDSKLMALRREVMSIWSVESPAPPGAGTLMIPAWTFDRGTARIHASPDTFADAGPLIGNDPRQTGDGMVEFDIDFPVSADYTLQIRYTAAEARPLDVLLDGKIVGRCCNGVTFGSAPFEQPVRFTWNSRGAIWEIMSKWRRPVKIPITAGKHTLTLSRRGPLPHLLALRLDSSAGFPKEWKQPRRRVRDLDSVPAAHRTAVLPPDSVNIGALRLSIEDMMKSFGSRYPDGEEYLRRLTELEKQQQAVMDGAEEQQQRVEESLVKLRRQAMLAHPALRFNRLLFVKRIPHNAHIYEDHCANAVGGNLCMLSPVAPDGTVTEVIPELSGGLFSRFDISFDATKVVFGYKKKDQPFRIHEIDLDPSTGLMVPGSLRQLTTGSEEEEEVIRENSWRGRGIGGGFNDMDPQYLPNGKILFTSTRSQRNVFCFPATVTTLHIMDADGGNMRCLSAGPLNEMTPCLLEDGRVAYTRWEYVDKGLGNGQSLWSMRPDGSGVDHLYKNSIVRPAGMMHARSIPGSQKIVTIGAPHCGREGGPVILVDTRATRRDTTAMTCLTPEVGLPCMYQATWDMGFFQEPYPLSEKFFLVSHSPAAKKKDKAGYGIYVLDTFGNRAELYRDPVLSCLQPYPLRPRRMPPQLPPVTVKDDTVDRSDMQSDEKPATLFIQDIYQGMTGIERGRVKYVRVMGVLPWPWDQEGMFRIGLNVGVHRKKVYGVANVHEDGSAHFTVPAGENILFQALDENYMVLQHMPTFINMKPGEQRSCIGCHEPRRQAPSVAAARPLALNQPEQVLAPQPGDTGPRMVDYAGDVQPILDRHCVNCHGGEHPEGHLDLTGIPTADFNRAYENLIGKYLVSYRDCRYGRSGFRPEAPLSYGSHISVMVERIRNEPCKAKLTREEFIRIVTWIDANVPYYGTYRGLRSIEDKDHPEFRSLPLAQASDD